MEFWASAEVDIKADADLEETRRAVEPFLNDAFKASSLNAIKVKLRYVPIVMPKDALENYPERSKLSKKEQIYDCAPHLNYDVFVTGKFNDQIKEYLRGIALSAPYLSDLGASQEQIKEFKEILKEAEWKILKK